MPKSIYERVERGRAQKAMAAQLGASSVPRTARNRRTQVTRQLAIAQMLNLRKRGAGGGLGLFEMMFGGPGGLGGGWPPGDSGSGDNGDGGGFPGGGGPEGGASRNPSGIWEGTSNIITPGPPGAG